MSWQCNICRFRPFRPRISASEVPICQQEVALMCSMVSPYALSVAVLDKSSIPPRFRAALSLSASSLEEV